MSTVQRVVLSVACLAAAATAMPASMRSSANSNMNPRAWTECPTGTWYSKCGQYDGCFNYDPCVSVTAPRAWTECAPGTWYSKCGQYDGCFNYDPCVAVTAPRAWTECAAGTWYSKCGKYDGCFNYDPCVAPPTEDTPGHTEPTCTTGTTTKAQRTIVGLTGNDRHAPSTGDIFQLQGGAGGNLEVFAVFSGIPADAKTCSVSWAQAPKSDPGNSFSLQSATPNAAIKTEQFNPVDLSGAVSWNSVETGRKSDGKVVTVDLAGFDKAEAGVPITSFGTVDCASEIYLKMTSDTTGGPVNTIAFGMDDKSGLFITYSTC